MTTDIKKLEGNLDHYRWKEDMLLQDIMQGTDDPERLKAELAELREEITHVNAQLNALEGNRVPF